jgi:ABC-type nitrate/sulfonate/bicarbonate transport system permease component
MEFTLAGMGRFYRRIGEALAVFMGLLIAWQVVTSLAHASFFPPPTAIAVAIAHNWLSLQALQTNVMPSFVRILLGWALASIIGIGVGVAIAWVRGLEAYFDPLIHFARAVPPPAALPIFLILFGIGSSMKVIFIAFGIVWPVLLNTIQGVQSIDSVQLESARVYQIRGWRLMFRVILPAASPEIFAGLRISLALGFVLMVISEMISASGGIGYEILQSQASFDLLNMWAGMVVLGIGGVIFTAVLVAVESWLLRWKKGGPNQTA